MMIHAECQKPDIITTAQWHMNAVGYNKSSCNRDYGNGVGKKGHCRPSDCVLAPKLLPHLRTGLREGVGEDFSQKAICVAVGFDSLPYLWRESEMIIREYLILQPQFLVPPNFFRF